GEPPALGNPSCPTAWRAHSALKGHSFFRRGSMDRLEQRAFAKAAWRLIPFMALLYVVSFLDRVNVGFAALTMNKDLGFTPEIYGFGAGIFFFGYFLFE